MQFVLCKHILLLEVLTIEYVYTKQTACRMLLLVKWIRHKIMFAATGR